VREFEVHVCYAEPLLDGVKMVKGSRPRRVNSRLVDLSILSSNQKRSCLRFSPQMRIKGDGRYFLTLRDEMNEKNQKKST